MGTAFPQPFPVGTEARPSRQISTLSLQSVQEVPEDDGEGIAETGSDRQVEVPDSCGSLPHTRIFGIFVKFFSPKSEGMSKPRSVGPFRFF